LQTWRVVLDRLQFDSSSVINAGSMQHSGGFRSKQTQLFADDRSWNRGAMPMITMMRCGVRRAGMTTYIAPDNETSGSTGLLLQRMRAVPIASVVPLAIA